MVKKKIDYLDPCLEEILKPTYGIIVYQEQIMQIASTLAGYSFGEADILRRAMSKKKAEVLLNEKDKFIKCSINKGYKKETAQKVYDLILKFASYGFNRAHSVAYSMISYRMAYLKAYYPNIFMKSLLNSNIGSEDKTREYIYECRANNLNILKPNINQSLDKYIIFDNYILFPLTGIKNVGINAVNYIIEERKKGLFKDIFDFTRRCYGKCINKKVLENLIYASCFSEFGINKKTLINNIDLITNYGELGDVLEDDDSLKPCLIEEIEYTKEEEMAKEIEIFGFFLSNHPVLEYRKDYPNAIKLSNINLFFNKNIEVIVYVDEVKEVTTKNSDKMCFISGSDELNSIDIVLFPKVYEELSESIIHKVVRIIGRVEKRYDKFQLIAESIIILN